MGSHVLLQLAEQGCAVRAIFRSESKKRHALNVFSYYHDSPEALFNSIEWVKGDVLDIPSLEEAMKGVTQVYHCAAAVTFIPSEEAYMHKVNTEGTANVVNLCLENPNVRLCHVSSVAAIGRDGSETTINEQNEWKDSYHNAAYAKSKHFAEMEIWRGITEGLNAFMVNPSLIIGPGDWSQSTGAMFQKVWKGLPFYTRGGNCFVDVRDVSAAMITLMDSNVHSERFIIGAENRSFRDVFGSIAKRMDRRPPRFEATPLMANLTWRVEKVVSTVLRKKPFITKEVAHHAMQLNRYDNAKLLRQLPDFKYRDLNESLDFVCEQFLKDRQTTGRN